MSEQPVNDIRVQVRFKNNLLLTAMEKVGFTNVALAERAGVTKMQVARLVCMKQPAKDRRDEWSNVAMAISSALHKEPEELFSWFQQTSKLDKTTFQLGAMSSEVARVAAPDGADSNLMLTDMREKIKQQLATLTAREERVLRLRFGMTPDRREHTLREISNMLGVSPERIRGIEAQALRNLKHPNRSRALREFVNLPTFEERVRTDRYVEASEAALEEHYHRGKHENG